MLTAIFGFLKTVLVKAVTFAVETVRGFIVDTCMNNILDR